MKIELHSNAEGFHGIGFLGKNLEVWLQLLPMTEWHFGRREIWYDGIIRVLGFGFWEVQWFKH